MRQTVNCSLDKPLNRELFACFARWGSSPTVEPQKHSGALSRLTAALAAAAIHAATPMATMVATPGVIQSIIDLLATGAFEHGQWRAFALGSERIEMPNASEWPDRFANQSVVVLGDSTMRFLAWHIVAHDHENVERTPVSKRLVQRGWNVTRLDCGDQGSGCLNCTVCCGTDLSLKCPKGKKQADHVDMVAHRASSGTHVTFSWKPELVEDDFEASAFRQRFCVEPPDLLFISKGGHEAAFRDTANMSARRWQQIIHTELRQYVHTRFSCLPMTTAIVWRTPDRSVRWSHEAGLLTLTTAVVRQAFRSGIFPPNAYLLDGFALTSSAAASNDSALVARDGHHYPHPVRQAEWELAYLAYRLHRMQLQRTDGA